MDKVHIVCSMLIVPIVTLYQVIDVVVLQILSNIIINCHVTINFFVLNHTSSFWEQNEKYYM